MELLAPAGNKASFLAALNGGADAIYLAGQQFGARSYATNFTNDELEEVLSIGKIYGVKVYVAMNTLVKDQEVESFLNQVEFLYHHGVDAIIMQDFGMIALCRQKYPNLVIHASTQFNSSNIETIRLLANMGVKRVVLPRELTKEEIAMIDVPIELEVFVHGALCVSYSGCCLFSQRLGGRSGNRGECAGSCRQFYQLYQGSTKIKEGYLLSMKDLKVGTDITKLPASVTSLKIEGRMKSPGYVSFMTTYYRQILDGKQVGRKEEEDLQSLFYRGFTKGHIFSETDLINPDSPNHIGLPIGQVIHITDDKITLTLNRPLQQGDGIRFVESKKGMMVNFLYDQYDRLIHSGNKGQIVKLDNKIKLQTEDTVHKTINANLEKIEDVISKKVTINIKIVAKKQQPLVISFQDEHHIVTYQGTVVENAKSSPIEQERLISQVSRLGNSPFQAGDIEVEMDEDIFVRIGELNIARRTLCERLIGKRLNDYPEPIITDVTYSKIAANDSPLDIAKYKLLPRNVWQYNQELQEACCLSNIIDATKINAIGSYHLNVFNAYTAYYLYQLGYKAITLSIELTEEEMSNLAAIVKEKFGHIPLIVKTRGLIEVMIIKGNVLSLNVNQKYSLKDRMNRCFPIYYDGRQTHILSHEPLWLDKEKLSADIIIREE